MNFMAVCGMVGETKEAILNFWYESKDIKCVFRIFSNNFVRLNAKK